MGIIISTILMAGSKYQASISNSEIEIKARAMGMEYPEQMKVITDRK